MTNAVFPYRSSLKYLPSIQGPVRCGGLGCVWWFSGPALHLYVDLICKEKNERKTFPKNSCCLSVYLLWLSLSVSFPLSLSFSLSLCLWLWLPAPTHILKQKVLNFRVLESDAEWLIWVILFVNCELLRLHFLFTPCGWQRLICLLY